MGRFREFTLPKGYVDVEGNLHKEGIMRLATAADEILPMKDPRVQTNPAYLTVILLSRVITKLGDLQVINANTIENLFASDLGCFPLRVEAVVVVFQIPGGHIRIVQVGPHETAAFIGCGDPFGFPKCRQVQPLIVIPFGIVIIVGQKRGVLDICRFQEKHEPIGVIALIFFKG